MLRSAAFLATSALSAKLSQNLSDVTTLIVAWPMISSSILLSKCGVLQNCRKWSAVTPYVWSSEALKAFIRPLICHSVSTPCKALMMLPSNDSLALFESFEPGSSQSETYNFIVLVGLKWIDQFIGHLVNELFPFTSLSTLWKVSVSFTVFINTYYGYSFGQISLLLLSIMSTIFLLVLMTGASKWLSGCCVDSAINVSKLLSLV